MCLRAFSPMPTWNTWSTPTMNGSWPRRHSRAPHRGQRCRDQRSGGGGLKESAGAARPGSEPISKRSLWVRSLPTCFFPRPPAWCKTSWAPRERGDLILSAACSAFLYSLQVGAQFIASGSAQARAGDWRGRDVVDHRLHRPRDLRDLRGRRGCGDSGASGGRFGGADRFHS